MTKARNIADLLDGNGDIVSSALDNVPASNDASALTTGTINNARISLDANEIPNLDTTKITSGTMATARLGSGTANSTTFLAGDGSYKEVSGGISWQSTIVTASTLNAVAGNGYWINTTSNACTITLPANPSLGNEIVFVDYARNFGTNKIIINPNSKKFQGQTSPNPEYTTNGQSVKLVYSDATKGWIPTVDDDVTDEVPQVITLEYLVIAGGGAGGGSHRGGGGGAGGYRNSYASETSGRNSSTETPYQFATAGTTVTVTVGGGGAVSSDANGGTGGTSSISASGQTTITSYGGGGGGEYGASANAGTYGSGGGAGHTTAARQGSDGTAGQGFDGGDTAGNSYQQGGCGGGAGGNGANGGTSSDIYAGVGLASSITGSSITRAGGGGAGGYADGGFGFGRNGGGNGGSTTAGDPHSGVVDSGSYYYPTSGTDNTGGGGGGTADDSNTTTWGRGGSGVVILRVATADYSGTTTGSPTVSTDGSHKVLIFNSSGSYTV